MGKVTFLGVEGSGKTVLTMAIAEAFREHESEGFLLRPDTRESFRFLVQNPSGLFHGEGEEGLPHQTTRLKYLKWTIMHQGQELRSFDTLDYPGEIYRLAFLDAKDSTDPDEFKERFAAHEAEVEELLGHLTDSDLVFVLFNLSDALDLAHNPDNLDAVWVTNACLGYLRRLPQKPRFALLLTQIDRYIPATDEAFDVRAFLKEKMPLIANNYPDLEVLAVSALKGGDGIHSINRIVFEALQDAAPVKQFLHEKQLYKQEFEAIPLTRVLTVSDLSKICSMGKAALEHLAITNANRPWFVDEWQLKKAELFIAPDEMVEIGKVFTELQEVLRQEKAKQKTEEEIIATIGVFLEQANLRTAQGKRLEKALMDKIRQIAQSYAEQRMRIAEQQRKDAERKQRMERETAERKRRMWLTLKWICTLALLGVIVCWGVRVYRGKVFLAEGIASTDDTRAAECFFKAAELGNTKAKEKLGILYALGRWKPRSEEDAESRQAEQAIERVRKLAEQGHAEAQYAIGMMYAKGQRGDCNDDEAVKWLRLAAEQGNSAAQGELGLMYFEGRGVEQSDSEALAWFQKAAEQGDAIGQCLLGNLYENGRGVERNDRVAVSWYRKAAEQGDADAQYNLGGMYANGLGVESNNVVAVAWFRKAAEQGFAAAQNHLGYMYNYGLGVMKDYQEAVAWFRKAAEQGHASAQCNLGVMYANGRGVERNDRVAVSWYRKAAEQGYADAQYNLGWMYANGRGVMKDYQEAVAWFRKAAEHGNADAKECLTELGESW